MSPQDRSNHTPGVLFRLDEEFRDRLDWLVAHLPATDRTDALRQAILAVSAGYRPGWRGQQEKKEGQS